MPQYKVIKRGFFHGRMYDPLGKRPVLVVDEPFKDGEKPSWIGDEVKQGEVVENQEQETELPPGFASPKDVVMPHSGNTPIHEPEAEQANPVDFTTNPDEDQSEQGQVTSAEDDIIETL